MRPAILVRGGLGGDVGGRWTIALAAGVLAVALALAPGAARAGGFGAVMVGFSNPFDGDSGSGPGFVTGAFGGYRLRSGAFIVQPELVGRYNSSAGAVVVGAGAAVTGGAPLAFGAYAHGGAAIVGDPRPSVDAGVVWQAVTAHPVGLGVRVGWHHDRPSQSTCDGCWHRSNNWAVMTMTLLVSQPPAED